MSSSEEWTKGTQITHPRHGSGIVSDVFWWDSPEDSLITITYKHGYNQASTSQAIHEKNNWSKVDVPEEAPKKLEVMHSFCVNCNDKTTQQRSWRGDHFGYACNSCGLFTADA